MKIENELLIKNSVIVLHEWIEEVFSNRLGKGQDCLISIGEELNDDFNMVTTSGGSVKKNKVRDMFDSSIGSRPDLKIDVKEVRVIHQFNENYLVKYKEKHFMNGASSERCSTALIEVCGNRTTWKYLHETLVS